MSSNRKQRQGAGCRLNPSALFIVIIVIILVGCNSDSGPVTDTNAPDTATTTADRFFWGRWVSAKSWNSSAFYRISVDDDRVTITSLSWDAGASAWVDGSPAAFAISSASTTDITAKNPAYADEVAISRVGTAGNTILLATNFQAIGKRYLSRDGGYRDGSSFSFSLFRNGLARTAAPIGAGPLGELSLAARPLVAATNISLVIQNVINGQALISATATGSSDATGASYAAGPFIPGDEYRITAGGESFTFVPTKEGEDSGSFVLTSYGYNFKVLPRFVDISAAPQTEDSRALVTDAILSGTTEDFLYPDTNYAIRLIVENRGSAASKPATITLSPATGLSVSPLTAGPLPAIPAGSSAPLDGTVSATGLLFDDPGHPDYEDLRLGFTTTTEDDSWGDAMSLRFYKGKSLVVARMNSGGFSDGTGSGALISPERRSVSFEGYFTGFIPRRDQGYLFSLSPNPYNGIGATGWAIAVGVDEPFAAPAQTAATDSNNTEETAIEAHEGEITTGSVNQMSSNADLVDFVRLAPSAEAGPAFSEPVEVAAWGDRILAVRGDTMVVSEGQRARAYRKAGSSWTATAEPTIISGQSDASAVSAAIDAGGNFRVLYLRIPAYGNVSQNELWYWDPNGVGSLAFRKVAGTENALGGIVAAGTAGFNYIWETRVSSKPVLNCDGIVVYSSAYGKFISYDAAYGASGLWIALAEGSAGTYGQTAAFHLSGGTWIKEDRNTTPKFNNTTTTYENLSSPTAPVSIIDLAIGPDDVPRLMAFQKPSGTAAFTPLLAKRNGATTSSSSWGFEGMAIPDRLLAGKDPAIALDSSNAVHLAYREGSRPVYLVRSGGAWVTRHLAGLGHASGRVFIDLASDLPTVYWYDPAAGAIVSSTRQ